MIHISCGSGDIDNVLIRFKCPHCNARDSAHIYMPDYCFKCGESHEYDATCLFNEQYERIYYHFNGYTTDYVTGNFK